MVKLLVLLSLAQVSVVNEKGRNLGTVPTIECGKTMTCSIKHNTWATINTSCSGVLGCIPVCSSGQFLSNDGGTLYCTSQIPNTYPSCAAGQFIINDGGVLTCATPSTSTYTGLFLSETCPPNTSTLDGGIPACQKDVPFPGGITFTGTVNNPDGGFYNVVTSVSCSAGVAGTGAGAYILALDDRTTATTICSCTMGAGSCATAAGTVISCSCVAGITSGDVYNLRITGASSCTVYPGALQCTMYFINVSH